MLKKLRWKFTAAMMGVITLMLVGIFSAYYLSFSASLQQESLQTLDKLIAQQGTVIHSPWSEKGETMIPFFMMDVYSGFASTVQNYYYDLSDAEMLSIASLVLQQAEDTGTLEAQNLRYARKYNYTSWRIVCLDTSFEQQVKGNLLRGSILVGTVAEILLFALTYLLSGWMVRPVARTWQMQQQFVSDASHELKTPLSVILSSAELILDQQQTEKIASWAENIKDESLRMKRLVNELLFLAREDEAQEKADTTVNLSHLTERLVLQFEPMFFECDITLESEISEDIFVQGQEERLYRAIAVLLDNGCKYAPKNSVAQVSLAMQGEKTAQIWVKNQGQEIPKEEQERLFHRFYRGDQSRGTQKGYGLGLSIAKSIVEGMRGEIFIQCEENMVAFCISLPARQNFSM